MRFPAPDLAVEVLSPSTESRDRFVIPVRAIFGADIHRATAGRLLAG